MLVLPDVGFRLTAADDQADRCAGRPRLKPWTLPRRTDPDLRALGEVFRERDLDDRARGLAFPLPVVRICGCDGPDERVEIRAQRAGQLSALVRAGGLECQLARPAIHFEHAC